VVGRVKTYEAIIKGDNIPEPGIPESFKVLLKELQALGLDVRVLREDMTEVDIQETVDYTERDYRFEMEGDRSNYNYENENLGAMGYQTQEFDEESEELVTVEEDYNLDEDMDFEE
jgi:DNA-directed RNA polymerase subunit beta